MLFACSGFNVCDKCHEEFYAPKVSIQSKTLSCSIFLLWKTNSAWFNIYPGFWTIMKKHPFHMAHIQIKTCCIKQIEPLLRLTALLVERAWKRQD